MELKKDKDNEIEELKKKIFNSSVPQFSIVVTGDPDLVNYDFKTKELQIIIHGVSNKIQNIEPETFYKYSDFLYSRGKFILR